MKKSDIANWVLLSAFLACTAAQIILVAPAPWFHWLLVSLAVTATVACLARALPLGNAIMAAVCITIFSGLAQILGRRLSLPYGTEASPLLWVAILLNSRGVARFILRRARDLTNRGLWTLGLSSLLAAILNPPFSILNFIGSAVIALLILVLIFPWLINKKPVEPPPPDFYPLLLWLATGALTLLAKSH